MFILIGGEGEIAFRLAEALMAGHEVAMVCPESARGTRLDRLDIEVVYGAITSTDVLRRARVKEADLFIACSAVDENNLVACVSARHLGARRTICFLLRLDLLAPGEDRKALAESLGIDKVILPAETLAEAIIRIVATPGALDAEVFAGGRVHLLRHAVEEGAPITRGTLATVGVPDDCVLVMARRGGKMFIPKGATWLRAGDKVTAMGTRAGIDRLLFGSLRRPRRRRDAQRATIVGGGTVGLAVSRGLEKAGWTLKIVEVDKARCEEIAPLLEGLVLHGDGTDPDLLASERIGDDPVLVAVSSNDEKNLLVSLLAKQLGVPRILTRVNTHANERLFSKVGVDVVLSARAAAVESVLQGIGLAKADLLAEVEHGEAQVIKLDVPEGAASRDISDLGSDVFAIIGAILRRGRVIIPTGADQVCGGDRLLVFCKPEHEQAVREFAGCPQRPSGR